MEGTSAAEATENESESQHKRTGSKSVKTRAQKDAHNARCVESRQKIKRRREELEQMVPKFKQMQTENQEMQTKIQDMKMELKQSKSKNRDLENSNQQLKRTLDTQRAKEARMRLIPMGWKFNGQNFSSFDECVEWFSSWTNVQDGQISGTCGTVLQDANEFVGLGATATYNFPPPMVDFYQQMGFGQDCSNITASGAVPSSVANHELAAVFDAPNSQGLRTNSAASSPFGANHDLPVFDAPNNHDNLFNNDLAAGVQTNFAGGSFFGAYPKLPIQFDDHENDVGLFTYDPAAEVLTNSAAGYSFGAKSEPPIVFDATNNHENDVDLFPHVPAAGFQENPSSEAVWKRF